MRTFSVVIVSAVLVLSLAGACIAQAEPEILPPIEVQPEPEVPEPSVQKTATIEVQPEPEVPEPIVIETATIEVQPEPEILLPSDVQPEPEVPEPSVLDTATLEKLLSGDYRPNELVISYNNDFYMPESVRGYSTGGEGGAIIREDLRAVGYTGDFEIKYRLQAVNFELLADIPGLSDNSALYFIITSDDINPPALASELNELERIAFASPDYYFSLSYVSLSLYEIIDRNGLYIIYHRDITKRQSILEPGLGTLELAKAAISEDLRAVGYTGDFEITYSNGETNWYTIRTKEDIHEFDLSWRLTQLEDIESAYPIFLPVPLGG